MREMRQRLQSMRSTAPTDARRLHEEVRSSAPPVEVSRPSSVGPPIAGSGPSHFPAIPTLVPSLDQKDAHFTPPFQFHSLGTQKIHVCSIPCRAFRKRAPQTSHYARSCIGASNQFLSNKVSRSFGIASGEEVGEGVVSSHASLRMNEICAVCQNCLEERKGGT